MVRHRRVKYFHPAKRSAGYERALQHIEDARQLSAELGGSDRVVKAYFFSLSPEASKIVLDDYEREYGTAARQYAEEAIPKWRTGRVKMSGQNAERLFRLLPPRMPLSAKYKLAENLWKHVGPSSKKRLRIGLAVSIEDVVNVVRSHIEQVVIQYRIPADLEHRFNWLSKDDVNVKQDLLNYVRNVEKSLVVEAARTQIPVMLEHLQSDAGRYTTRLAQVLKVGKHELELLPDREAVGVTLEDPPAFSYGSTYHSSGTAQNVESLWSRNWPWLILIVVILWLISHH